MMLRAVHLAVAALAVPLYCQPAIAGVQHANSDHTVGQTSGNPGAATPALADSFDCGQFRASGSDTALDRCWAAVQANWLARATANTYYSATISLSPGVWPTCRGLVMPAPDHNHKPLVITLRGSGTGTFGDYGTKIQASCPMQHAVIALPWEPVSGVDGGSWSDIRLSSFSIDANGLAQSCLDAYGLRESSIEHITCSRAIGTDHWVALGDVATKYGGQVPEGYLGTGFQVFVNDLFVYYPSITVEKLAHITPVIKRGEITGYEIRSPGIYILPSWGPMVEPVSLAGAGAHGKPCSAGMDNIYATMAPYPDDTVGPGGSLKGFFYVASIKSETRTTGCEGEVFVQVPNIPAAEYGVKFSNTDSTADNILVDAVGAKAAFQSRTPGANLFSHLHAWQTPVLFEDWGGATYVAPECDNAVLFCFSFPYGAGTKIIAPKFFWFGGHVPQLAGSSGYSIAGSVSNLSISDEDCGPNLQDNGGYMHLHVMDYGEISSYEPVASKVLASLRDAHACSSRPARKPAPPASNDACVAGSSWDLDFGDAAFHYFCVRSGQIVRVSLKPW